jgi:hypothetical protein
MAHIRLLSAACLLVLAFDWQSLLAQESKFAFGWPNRPVWVPDSTKAPIIDGDVGNKEWQQAAVLEDFTRHGPLTRRIPAKASLKVRLTRHGGQLYLGADCPLPAKGESNGSVVPGGSKDHGSVWRDDCLEIFFAPDLESSSYTNVTINSDGAAAEYRSKARGIDYAWNPSYTHKVKRSETGWTLEMAISLADIMKDPKAEILAFNIGRHPNLAVTPSAVYSWSLDGWCRPGNFGRLHFGERIAAVKDSAIHSDQVTVRIDGGKENEKVTFHLKGEVAGKSVATVKEAVLTAKQVTEVALLIRFGSMGKGQLELRILKADGKPLQKAGRSGLYVERNNPVEYFLVHQVDIYPGQEFVGTSLMLARKPTGESARVTLRDPKGKPVFTRDLGPLKQRLNRLPLNVAGLKEGNYEALCTVSDAEGKVLGEDAAVLRVMPVPEPRQTSIPVRIAYAPRTTGNRFPITVGVPFARGVLPASEVPGRLTLLNDSGDAIPVQCRVVAWWSSLKRHVQWLHLDFIGSVKATGRDAYDGKPNEIEGLLSYTLVHAPEDLMDDDLEKDAADPLSNPVKVTQKNNEWVLENGLLRLVLDPAQENPFKDISLSKREAGPFSPLQERKAERFGPQHRLLGSQEGAGFFVRGETGNEYALSTPQPWKSLLEKEGPVTAGVRLEASLLDASGLPVGRLIVRVRLHEGVPRLSVSHTFVYTGRSDTVQIRGMGLRLPFKPVKSARFGLDEFQTADAAGLKDGPVRFLQSSWYRCTLEQGRAGKRKLLGFADFAPGWMDLDLGDAHAVVNFRAGLFWKEYPKEFYRKLMK